MMEYGTIVGNPYMATNINKLDIIQEKQGDSLQGTTNQEEDHSSTCF